MRPSRVHDLASHRCWGSRSHRSILAFPIDATRFHEIDVPDHCEFANQYHWPTRPPVVDAVTNTILCTFTEPALRTRRVRGLAIDPLCRGNTCPTWKFNLAQCSVLNLVLQRQIFQIREGGTRTHVCRIGFAGPIGLRPILRTRLPEIFFTALFTRPMHSTFGSETALEDCIGHPHALQALSAVCRRSFAHTRTHVDPIQRTRLAVVRDA